MKQISRNMGWTWWVVRIYPLPNKFHPLKSMDNQSWAIWCTMNLCSRSHLELTYLGHNKKCQGVFYPSWTYKKVVFKRRLKWVKPLRRPVELSTWDIRRLIIKMKIRSTFSEEVWPIQHHLKTTQLSKIQFFRLKIITNYKYRLRIINCSWINQSS